MKSRISILIACGVLVQFLALFFFCWFARVAPESKLKLIGLGVLLIGELVVVFRLFVYSRCIVFFSIFILSCATPIVLSLVALLLPGLAKNVNILSVERVGAMCCVACLAMLCYFISWGAWYLWKAVKP